MCCWTSNRDDGAYVDNTDICSHEVANSKGSAHVKAGTTILGDAGDARCHGFIFSEEDTYKGNLLFKVAMEEGFLNGYVRNVPSAPMCACLEQMPVVTTASCSSIDDYTESWESSYDGSPETFYISQGDDVSITFGNCEGKDLATYMNEKIQDSDFKADKRLIGSCEDNVKQKLEDVAFRKREEEMVSWIPVGGKGLLYDKSPEDFAAVWAKSNNQILRRRCLTCVNSHKDIYYRRFDTNGLPDEFDLLHIMKNYWYTDPYVTGNKFNEDFKLYSTYEDAVNDVKEWKYCNFKDKTGFPRDCGPYSKTDHQWSTFHPYDGRHGGKGSVAFYVEGGGVIIPE